MDNGPKYKDNFLVIWEVFYYRYGEMKKNCFPDSYIKAKCYTVCQIVENSLKVI